MIPDQQQKFDVFEWFFGLRLHVLLNELLYYAFINTAPFLTYKSTSNLGHFHPDSLSWS